MPINRRQFNRAAAISAAVPIHLMSIGAALAAAQNRIHIGQIGLGHAHAVGKLQAILNFPDQYELVGVVEPDAAKRRDLMKKDWARDVKFVSEEQLLNTKGLRVVAVETEVKDLIATASKCIGAGVHIHLDKPAGTDYAGIEGVTRDAVRQNLTIQMGYMLRYNPAFELMYKAVREGWLGEVFSIHAEMSKAINDPSRANLARYPGGAMFELGCHIIDSVVYLLGEPRSVSTHALMSRHPQDDLLDNQVAVFDYANANATVRAAVNEVDGQRRRQFVVMGSEGTMEIRPLESGKIHLALNQARGGYKKGAQDLELGKGTGRYDGEFIDLAKVIRGEKELAWSHEHNLMTHRTVLKAAGMGIS
jgi:predicted dehydrogenase